MKHFRFRVSTWKREKNEKREKGKRRQKIVNKYLYGLSLSTTLRRSAYNLFSKCNVNYLNLFLSLCFSLYLERKRPWSDPRSEEKPRNRNRFTNRDEDEFLYILGKVEFYDEAYLVPYILPMQNR